MRPRRIARPFTGTYIQTQQSEERSGKQKQKQQQQQQHDGGSLAADVRRKPRFTVLSASTRLIRFSCRQPPSRKAGSALRGNVNTHTHTRQRERRNRKSQGVEKNVTTRSVATQNSRESAQVLSARAPGWYYCVFLSFFFFFVIPSTSARVDDSLERDDTDAFIRSLPLRFNSPCCNRAKVNTKTTRVVSAAVVLEVEIGSQRACGSGRVGPDKQ